MHTHQISRQELEAPTVGLNFTAWAKEIAIKSRVKFSNNASTTENVISSVACTQHESISKRNKVASV